MARMKRPTDKSIAKLSAQLRDGSPSWSNEGAPANKRAGGFKQEGKVVFNFRGC